MLKPLSIAVSNHDRFASSALLMASSIVSPTVKHPGKSGKETTYPPLYYILVSYMVSIITWFNIKNITLPFKFSYNAIICHCTCSIKPYMQLLLLLNISFS